MEDQANLLIYPGDPDFDLTLTTFPPNWRQFSYCNSGDVVFAAEPGSGVLRQVNADELTEYLHGGEYDERLHELDAVE